MQPGRHWRNSIVEQACKVVNGQQVFSLIEQEMTQHAADQLKVLIRVCEAFKSTYYDYKVSAKKSRGCSVWS